MVIKALRSKGQVGIHIPEENAINWKNGLKKEKSAAIKIVIESEDFLLQEWMPLLNSGPSEVSSHFIQDAVLQKIKYEKMVDSPIDDEELKKETDATVMRYAKGYLGCVIEFDVGKVIITSLDAFVHLGHEVDDCANRMLTKEKHGFAKIREKANFGVSSYEISIFIGALELIAVGGVAIDNQEDSSCFLGPSIMPLIPIMTHATNTASQQIWTASTPIEAMA